MKELITIQSELKAPKSQFNRFGGYKYRKAEDILEAVKPLLAKEKCSLVLTDDIVSVGNRIYVKSLATLKNNSGETEMSVGYAREEETKKGMDGSQITGASSSYARKSALNGLFAIDDNADSDTTNTDTKSEASTQQASQSTVQQTAQQAAPVASKYNPNNLQEAMNYLNLCKTKENLVWVMQTYKPLMSNAQMMQALSAKRKELKL